jgi:hypothetical protein
MRRVSNSALDAYRGCRLLLMVRMRARLHSWLAASLNQSEISMKLLRIVLLATALVKYELTANIPLVE